MLKDFIDWIIISSFTKTKHFSLVEFFPVIQTGNNNLLYKEVFKFSNSQVDIKRKVYDIVNVSSEVGGFISVVQFCLAFLMSKYASLEFQLSTQNL